MRALAFLLITCLLTAFVASAPGVQGKEGPAGSDSAGTASSEAAVKSTSGGGSRYSSLDSFIRQVEGWKSRSPDKFGYLKKLLYIEPLTPRGYTYPSVWVYFGSNNTTVSRREEVRVGAVVRNDNPIEIRRPLYLTLEIKEPGDSVWRAAPAATQIIQINEYDDVTNTTVRVFPDVTSFESLKRVGEVGLRVKATDGQYLLSSSPQRTYVHRSFIQAGELNLSIYNIPPQINNSTMQVKPMDARWDDYIQFTALLEDGNVTGQQGSDDQAVQVTLHILEGDEEVRSITKPFLPGSMVLFSTKDRPLFNESDAGKNFSYRYSCTDGILGGRNTSWSMIGQGPNLKAESKILVKDMVVTPEDQNCYWWQRYSFGLKAKSWNPDGEILTVTLFTDTPAHPGKRVASKTVRIQGDNYTDVVFEDLEPFDVRDSGQPFRYYFEYSLPDEKGETRSQLLEGPRAINTKLVRYKIYSPVMAANLIAILAACLLLGMGLERRDGILEWALRRWRR